MRFSRWCVVIALVSTAPGVARDVYVNNIGGEDTYNGDSPTSEGQGTGPVRSLRHALKIAKRGDRVVLAKTEKPYRESAVLFGIKNSGYEDQPFVIDGNGATLIGSQSIPAAAWEHITGNVFRFQPRRKGYQQLFIDGLPVVRAPITGPRRPVLGPLEWCYYNGHIYLRCEKGKTPRSYQCTDASISVALTLHRVDHVVIRDLVIRGFQLDGINAHDTARNCVFSGIVSQGNGRSGISIGGASRVTLQDCSLGENGKAQLRVEGHASVDVRRSELLGDSAPRWELSGGQLWIDGQEKSASDE
jgi:hypothetical protein